MNIKRIRLLAGAAMVAVIAVCALLINAGIWQLNHPKLPVKGVDVSHYQGNIDWPTLAKAGDLRFAFVKATEGSGAKDETFDANWAGARAAGLRTGAYHFFSYDSPGADQAENYISAVPVEPDALPPVIDVEFYGAYFREPAPPDAVVPQLRVMIDALRERYGTQPILYVTSKAYGLYVKGSFDDCDIWIRNVFMKPALPDKREWTFWQYTDRAKLPVYNGVERFIDLNVFNGDAATFDAYRQ